MFLQAWFEDRENNATSYYPKVVYKNWFLIAAILKLCLRESNYFISVIVFSKSSEVFGSATIISGFSLTGKIKD